MGKRITLISFIAACAAAITTQAATYYVAINGNDTAAGTSWPTAKRTIQAAIDASGGGDTIIVTNGTYGVISTANKAITIQSVNGAAVTIIDGGGTARCTTLGSSSKHTATILSGFTLTNGNGDVDDLYGYGGGTYGGTLNNCTLSGNTASSGGGASYSTLNNCTLSENTANWGGGADYCTLNNCLLTGNSATNSGGGADYCTLNNCTLTENMARGDGGGAYACTLNNCIVWDNTAPNGSNYSDSTFACSCTSPLPNGNGNTDLAPFFADAAGGDYRLSPLSPCIDSGSDALIGGLTDLDGKPRIIGAAADMGAYEWGTPPLLLGQGEVYVDVSRPDNSGDGSSWAAAKRTIPAALVLAAEGGTIIVADGFYAPISTANKAITIQSVNGAAVTIIDGGGIARCATLGWNDSHTNSVITGFTLINGYIDEYNSDDRPGGGVFGGTLNDCTLERNTATWGGGASYSMLNNCTLTENMARGDGGGAYACTLNNCTLTGNTASSGGGASYSTLNNCVLAGNEADEGSYYANGGGANYCTLNDCFLARNKAIGGGGAVWSILNNCTLTENMARGGGGADDCTLNNCTLSGNSANWGGGADYCTLNNCLLTGNSATNSGGGADYCTLNNCTLTENEAAIIGGGASGGTLNNCIVWGNTAPSDPNYSGGVFAYSCDFDPLFVDAAGGDYRLSLGSLCIDSGSEVLMSVVTDMDGKPRILGESVDMGVYEFGTPPPEQRELYVDMSRPDNSGDGTSWATAKRTILAAVVIAAEGGTVTVADGNYAPISTANKTVTIQSVNGAAMTIIDGGGVTRCATLGWNSSHTATVLAGFTLTNGYVASYGGGAYGGTLNNCTLIANWADEGGGGAYRSTLNTCTLTKNTAYYHGGGAYDGMLSNCTLTENEAYYDGGGAYACTLNTCMLGENISGGCGGGAVHSTLINCTLTENRAPYGGGAYECMLNDCTLIGNDANSGGYGFGGGAAFGTLNNCTLTGNSADWGGGADYCTLNNCLLTGNSADNGGGAAGGTLNNCILTGNTAGENGGGAYGGGTLNNCTLTKNIAGKNGGGASDGTLNNCIVWDNTAATASSNHFNSSFTYSCTSPLPNGNGNIDLDPIFVDAANGDYRLQVGSPCIDTGDNALVFVATDLADTPRIIGVAVDMGAYEWRSVTVQPTEYELWLETHSLANEPENYAKWLVDPSDLTAVFTAEMKIVNGKAEILWTPDLGAARAYVIEGKEHLTDTDWTVVDPEHMPMMPAYFFRVKVKEAP